MNLKIKQKGFTLLEALFAAMLIGLAVASLVAAGSAFTMSNAAALDLSTAEFLIEEIRSMTASLPVVDPEDGTSVFGIETGETSWDDLDDLDGLLLNPPVDVSRQPMNEFAVFKQNILVENVYPWNLEDTSAGNHSTDYVRVTVNIFKNNKQISSAAWIRARLN